MENKELVLFEYAGFFKRLGARLIDAIIYFLTFLLLFITLNVFLAPKVWPGEYKEYSNYEQLLNDKVSRDNNLSFEYLTKLTSDSVNCTFDSKEKELNQACELGRPYVRHSQTIVYLPLFIISVFYFSLLSVSKWQGSIGKKVLGLKIVTQNNQKITLLQAFAREIFWILAGLMYLIGIYFGETFDILNILLLLFIFLESLKITFTGNKTSVHDNIAKTFVVYEKEEF